MWSTRKAPEQPVDSSHRELKTCPAGARLSFPLHLSALTTTRHACNLYNLKIHLALTQDVKDQWAHDYLELVYLVTALVPSDTACLASSPGRRRRTAVWISREVMVDLKTSRNNKSGKRTLPLVVMGQLARLSSNPLEQVVDKGVHDGHGLWRDSGVGMNLFQNLGR